MLNHDVLDYFYSSSSPSSSSDLNQPSSLTKLALNSFLGILISSPLIAKEIVPVSSETTTVNESVISLIPIAARCLAP